MHMEHLKGAALGMNIATCLHMKLPLRLTFEDIRSLLKLPPPPFHNFLAEVDSHQIYKFARKIKGTAFLGWHQN